MKVSFVTHTVFHYRREFHEKARQLLEREGVDYEVLYGQPDRSEARKADTVDLTFGERIRNRYIYAQQPPLVYQPVLRRLMKSDLAIIVQENRLLTNYLLQGLPPSLRPRIALFGHGRNFQSRSPDGRNEWWKRRWARRCDWWFGYTGQTREHLVALGFPERRITVFNNAMDTSSLRRDLESATPELLEARRKALGLRGGAVGLFVGGLYADKRLEFLIDAAVRVQRRLPEFELVIVGGGPAEAELRAAAAPYPWIKVTGAQFGQAKAEIMRLADLFLMPGLVGLAVLDAGHRNVGNLTDVIRNGESPTARRWRPRSDSRQ